METLIIKTTHHQEVIDLTDQVQKLISSDGKRDGFSLLFVKHTTCALTTADLDPGTDLDLLEAFQKMIPKIAFRHPHDPSHTKDHLLASLIGPSVIVPIKEGKLTLGTWQRIVLVEFNGPREREILVFSSD